MSVLTVGLVQQRCSAERAANLARSIAGVREAADQTGDRTPQRADDDGEAVVFVVRPEQMRDAHRQPADGNARDGSRGL